MAGQPTGPRRSGFFRSAFRLPLLVLAMSSFSCGSAGLSYYSHVLRGGFALVQGRRPIDQVIADPETPPVVRQRLETASDAREFASRVLLLPSNKSYRTYKDLDRPYATWTVVAAPELSLVPLEWCFPIAGCVSYRGYFRHSKAEKFAARLRARGYDVDLGGVRAFSSLGWFADPVLNTFIDLKDYALVGLIFHELSHQQLYVKGDTTFNESFATVVEDVGVRRWLETRDDSTLLVEYLAERKRQRQWIDLALDGRQRLEGVYSSSASDESKRAAKAEVLSDLRSSFSELAASSAGWEAYGDWFGEGLNNARLLAVAAYHDHEPAFRALLARCAGELQCFYDEAAALGALSVEDRSQALADLAVRSPKSDFGVDSVLAAEGAPR